MEKPSTSLSYKAVTLMAAIALMFSMMPVAWADDAPAGTLAGSVASSASGDETAGPAGAEEGGDAQAPAAEVQSADAKAADGGSGGTTISIAVYRSSFPIMKWDLNDQDNSLTKAEWAWADRTGELPKDASPGSEVTWPESGKPADYAEPERAGFEFAGWSTDKSASAGGFIDGASPKLTMPEGAPTSDPKGYTLYALWTPLEYSVIFDLAKNPEVNGVDGIAETVASFKLNWDSADGVRTVTPLGGGRFLVEGFTMKESDYDEITRTVGLPEPSRTGFRFLGWAEPDGQSLAIDNAAKDGFALNPVRLTQIDGTPVLTARWTSAFGVTAPLSITFGDYDKTGAPGNPWLGDKGQTAADDTTQAQQDKEGASEQEGYAKGGQAYFENTGWHEAVKLVGITSTRHANANQVLTTYDSKQASEAAVLGDGTEENPGERLLSLYPSASAPSDDKSSGVHFRLTDALDESVLGSAFTMAPQGEEGAKKEISYGLNLSTDPTDGSANHGLVLPTNDYERKQIATVSYTFATADGSIKDDTPISGQLKPTGSKTDPFWIENVNLDWGPTGVYGLDNIKSAAADLSIRANDPTASPYYNFYKHFLDAQVMSGGNATTAPYFQLKVDGHYLAVQLIGICQDTKSAGGTAGLTFQLRDAYAYKDARSAAAGTGTFECAMNPTNTAAGGWQASSMRGRLRETFMGSLEPAFQAAIMPVDKYQQLGSGETDPTTGKPLQKTPNETIWLLSAHEVYGNSISAYNDAEHAADASGYAPFQYQAYQGSDSATIYAKAIRRFANSSVYTGAVSWRFRSARQDTLVNFTSTNSVGNPWGEYAANFNAPGVVPAFCL